MLQQRPTQPNKLILKNKINPFLLQNMFDKLLSCALFSVLEGYRSAQNMCPALLQFIFQIGNSHDTKHNTNKYAIQQVVARILENNNSILLCNCVTESLCSTSEINTTL